MRSLSKIDLPGRLAPVMPRWAGEAITALICLAVTGVSRVAMDVLIPGAAPFVLIFPACLVATLVGGWRAGAATLGIAAVAAWAYVIPPRGLVWKGGTEMADLVAVVIAGAVVIVVAQLFRASSRSEAEQGRAEVAERDLMLRELEHRMKNNFQTVAALLSTQLRRATDEPAREALREALNRVTSISQAHHNLYAPGDHTQGVEMGVYLGELCDNLAEALLLGEKVRLRCNIEPGALDRDRAVAIGLIVNELVTNAAKHAFTEGGAGQIRVAFGREAHGYRLIVEDDGQGLPADYASRPRGLGRGLVEAFTRQAGGSLTVGKGPGARFEVELAA